MFWIVFITKVITMADNGIANRPRNVWATARPSPPAQTLAQAIKIFGNTPPLSEAASSRVRDNLNRI
jgi:hypothetical protein